MAAEEKKHRDILTKIYTGNTMDRYFSESRDYKVAETVDEPELSMAMKPADAFALAMKKEEAAMKQYTGMAEMCADLSEALGLPVIDGVVAAVKLAEALASGGFATSKAGSLAYPRDKSGDKPA